MPKFQSSDAWRRPELFLAELINKSVRHEFREYDDNVRVWHRATVVAVDVFGGRLENPDAAGILEHVIDGETIEVEASLGPVNPRNSVKARILTEEFDQYLEDESLRVFWPLFPEHDMVPIKPGEHVYVMFEGEESNHGLWLGKVPGHNGVNFFKGETSFVSSDQRRLAQKFDDSTEEQKRITDADASGRLVTAGKNKLFGDS